MFRFGLWDALPPKLSRCDSPQLSPLRLAVQRALLDADMNALIDRSSCLVEPVLVLSRARAVGTEHVQRRVRSLLAKIPIARPCGRSCASEMLAPRASLLLLLTCSRPLQDLPLLRTPPCSGRSSPQAAHQVVVPCDLSLSTLWFRCESGVFELLGCVRQRFLV